MKYFLDTEFIETGMAHPIQLISLGIRGEDERELYVQNADCHFYIASNWIREHVFPKLTLQAHNTIKLRAEGNIPIESMISVPTPSLVRPWARYTELRMIISDFINESSSRPEFWGYYSDYDWVLFSQIFGRMIDLPSSWPRYCRDLKQLVDALGNPKLQKPIPMEEHHALYDARWLHRTFLQLEQTHLIPTTQAGLKLFG